MVGGLANHCKNISPNQLQIQIPPQIVRTAHDQDHVGMLLNHLRVKAAQQTTGGVPTDAAVDNVDLQATGNL